MSANLHWDVVLEEEVVDPVLRVVERAVGIVLAVTFRTDVERGFQLPLHAVWTTARCVVDDLVSRAVTFASGRALVRDGDVAASAARSGWRPWCCDERIDTIAEASIF